MQYLYPSLSRLTPALNAELNIPTSFLMNLYPLQGNTLLFHKSSLSKEIKKMFE